MIKKYLTNLVSEKAGLTTYDMGLLQAKAFRILKNRTTDILKPYDISTVDWAMLGLLSQKLEGVGVMQLAGELGVEAPFVTELVKNLEKKGLVQKRVLETDKRNKSIVLTKAGERFVEKTEEVVRGKIKGLLSGSSISDILGYRKVLKTIIENGKED